MTLLSSKLSLVSKEGSRIWMDILFTSKSWRISKMAKCWRLRMKGCRFEEKWIVMASCWLPSTSDIRSLASRSWRGSRRFSKQEDNRTRTYDKKTQLIYIKPTQKKQFIVPVYYNCINSRGSDHFKRQSTWPQAPISSCS